MTPRGIAMICDLPALRLADGGSTSPSGDPRFVPGEPFQIFRVGVFHSPIYGRIDITPQDLATMFRNFKTRTLPPTQLPIDYDHLSDDPKKPGDGKAAGWVEDLELRDGGQTLWATPKWTKTAAAMLAKGEYRYCSPMFLRAALDKRTGKRIGPQLRAVAITNRPFLEGMSEIHAPIAAAERVAYIDGRRMESTPMAVSATELARLPGESDVTYRWRQRMFSLSERDEQARSLSAAPLPETPGDADGIERLKKAPLASGISACSMCSAPLGAGGKYVAADDEAPSPLSCPHCGSPVTYAGSGSIAAGEVSSRDASGAPVVLREIQQKMLRERRQRDGRPVI